MSLKDVVVYQCSFILPLIIICTLGCAFNPSNTEKITRPTLNSYPPHWFAPVPREQAAWWEVLPQDANPGEVILSKRNTLGLLSNFAATPFTLDGIRYASLEGFWQMMAYPEGPDDSRALYPGIKWKYTREEVAQMTSFQAKAAGDLAKENMKKMDINWVTYQGEKMDYYTPQKGSHYNLIVRACWAKINQNSEVKQVLLETGDLILRPDHILPTDAPPSWHYFNIYMEIRNQLRKNGEPSSS